MTRLVFLNGKYLEEKKAKISIFDRGVLFSDSVYEVTAFINDKLLDFRSHLTRLQRSLDELNINYKDPQWLEKRAILCPRNKTVNEIKCSR